MQILIGKDLIGFTQINCIIAFEWLISCTRLTHINTILTCVRIYFHYLKCMYMCNLSCNKIRNVLCICRTLFAPFWNWHFSDWVIQNIKNVNKTWGVFYTEKMIASENCAKLKANNGILNNDDTKFSMHNYFCILYVTKEWMISKDDISRVWHTLFSFDMKFNEKWHLAFKWWYMKIGF